jgi:hypothetical protein
MSDLWGFNFKIGEAGAPQAGRGVQRVRGILG